MSRMLPADHQKAQQGRANPAGLAWYESGGAWIPADHLLLLTRKIVKVAKGDIPRLMVTMPPRHGKSELISKYTPAWFLGTFPDKKVMLASYADTFAAQWGRRARDVFATVGEDLWGLDVNKETAGGQSWEVKGRNGIMTTAGVGGGMTGKGADLLIIDDPIKNQEEALSEKNREAQHDWWKSTARTRLQAGAGVIFVMTRWHEDDLMGRLIADWQDEDGDEWEILNLPGLAEETTSASYPSAKTLDLGPDPLNRAPGEALWPQIGFDEKWMAQTKRALQSAGNVSWFDAMYQQRPSAASGNMFKAEHFRYYERIPGSSTLTRLFHGEDRNQGLPEVFDIDFGMKFMTADTAQTEKKKSDWTVVSVWVKTVNGDLLLWRRERQKLEGPKIKGLIARMCLEEKPAFVYIEQTDAARSIVQELVLEGYPVRSDKPDDDKVSRAWPMVARYESHRVFHPRGAAFGWVSEEWEPELKVFPNGRNDDQVDTASYAGKLLPTLSGGATARGGKVERDSEGNVVVPPPRHLTAADAHSPGVRRARGHTHTAGTLHKQF